MKQIIKANTRGIAPIPWLEGYHSFSFGHYYNPDRMGFHSLRVLNDDTISPHNGFDTHPHDNMEIITIVLDGELTHKDSMGTQETLKPGQIQIMSAGTGVTHSEINMSDKPVSLLQIWIEPKEMNIKPSYKEKEYTDELIKNKLYEIVNNTDIAQDAKMYLTKASKEISLQKSNWYIFVIDGEVKVGDELLTNKDAIQTDESITLTPQKETFMVIFEV